MHDINANRVHRSTVIRERRPMMLNVFLFFIFCCLMFISLFFQSEIDTDTSYSLRSFHQRQS